MTSQSWLTTLSCLLLLSAATQTSLASVALAPDYFEHLERDAYGSATPAIDLRAPAHLVNRGDRDFASLQEQLQVHSHLRHRSLFPRRSPSTPSQSSANPNDKLQQIGYLSGAYNAPLNISSDPTQLVFVQLDTGSSDLWITSSACASPACQSSKVLKFNAAESKSYQEILVDASARLNLTTNGVAGNATNSSSQAGLPSLGAGTGGADVQRRQSAGDAERVEVPFSIQYSDNMAASGVLASDTISLSNLSISQQTFALINATNVTLADQGISGVLGLGFPRGSTISRSLIEFQDQIGDTHTFPLLTNLLQTSNESYPLFGLYLTRDGGRATFGAVDSSLLPTSENRAQVEWYDVAPFPSGDTALPANDTLNVDGEALGPYVQWVLPLTAAGVGGNPAILAPTYSEVGRYPLALIDSGSSSILGPASAVESIFSQITNSRHVGGGRFIVPCDTTSRMYFSFGGRNITLLPNDYIIGPDAAQPYLCFAWPAAASPDATGVDWILGTPFLRAVYSIFSIGINDKEPPKIGLYPLNQPANATDPSVIFAPESTASLSSFLANQATTIASQLPNSLVSLDRGSMASYFFANATVTPSIGVVPTRVGVTSTYQPALPTEMGGKGASGIPAIASSSSPISVPRNPAETGKRESNAASRSTDGAARQCSAVMAAVVAAMVLVF